MNACIPFCDSSPNPCLSTLYANIQIIGNERLKHLRFSVDSLKLFKSMIHQNNAVRNTLNSAGKKQNDKLTCFIRLKRHKTKASEYGQEIPQAHTAGQPTEEPQNTDCHKTSGRELK